MLRKALVPCDQQCNQTSDPRSFWCCAAILARFAGAASVPQTICPNKPHINNKQSCCGVFVFCRCLCFLPALLFFCQRFCFLPAFLFRASLFFAPMSRAFTVVTIDSFDHADYDAVPQIFSAADPPGTRSHLFGNYAVPRRDHTDRRRSGTNVYRPYVSSDYERYQHLLLSSRPIVHDTFGDNVPDTGCPGYELNRAEALLRYGEFLASGEQWPIEVLHCRTDIGTGRLSAVTQSFNRRRRYALNISLGPTQPLMYTGTTHRRHLWLQPGTVLSPEPISFRNALGFLRLLTAPPGSSPDGKYAVGCTCRSFVIGGATAEDGTPGRSSFGCKHILFYNVCVRRNKVPPIPVS